MAEYARKKVFGAAECISRRFRAVWESASRSRSGGRSNERPGKAKPKEKSYLHDIGIGKSITTHAIRRAVHSRPAVRKHLFTPEQPLPRRNSMHVRENPGPNLLGNEEPRLDVYSVTAQALKEERLMIIGPPYKARLQRRARFLLNMKTPDDNFDFEAEGQPTPSTSDHVEPDVVIELPLDAFVNSPLDCNIVTDAKGQDWLESEDPISNQLKYVNLKEGSNIIESSTKLNANEIALLNLSKPKAPMAVPVLGFQKKYMKPNETKTLSKNGNMGLLAAGQTSFTEPLSELIGSTLGLQSVKWRFPNEARLSNSQTNQEEDSFQEESEYFNEQWRRSAATMELPLANISTAEVNLSRLNSEKKDIVFMKDDLSNVHVIGQLDNKFIIGRLSTSRDEEPLDLLVLFDQHAVHERIRLEKLLDDVYEEEPRQMPEGQRKQVQTVGLKPPIKIDYNETELRILNNLKIDLELVGLYIETFADVGAILVHYIPKCFAEKISNEAICARDESVVKLTYQLLEEQLSYVLDMKQQNRGLPKTIFDLLCSQACHGAIKFGDKLTLEVCRDLIKRLDNCQLPFQCAHGRPAVIPLINL